MCVSILILIHLIIYIYIYIYIYIIIKSDLPIYRANVEPKKHILSSLSPIEQVKKKKFIW